MKWTMMMLGILLGSALACAVEQNDFAYGYRLDIQEDGAIYTLALPEAVYRGMTRADRGDLRILNGQGLPVPHAIRLPEEQRAQPDRVLPHFPLYRAGQDREYHARIATSAQGTIVEVQNDTAHLPQQHLAAYLFDASALTQPPQALTFSWPSDHEAFVMTVRLDGSDDLHQWRPLVRGAALSTLQYGSYRLLQQRLDLPLTAAKYLRLTWEGTITLHLEHVTAHFAPTPEEQPRHWTSFTATRDDPKHAVYIFDTQAHFPVDRLRVQLPQRNSLIRAAVEVGSSANGPWQTLYQGLLYDLEIDKTSLKTPDVIVRVQRQRYWRLRMLDIESQLGGMPGLQLGWVPEQVFFLAQGTAPFLLAYGSARVEPAATPLAEFLREETLKKQGKHLKTASLGEQIILGNSAVLRAPGSARTWKLYLLWGVLGLGVLVLGGMSVRLYRQMQQGTSDADAA